MNKLQKFLTGLAALLVFAVAPAFAQQYTLTQTTLTAAISPVQTTFALGSLTNIQATNTQNFTDLYIDRELMQVVSVNTAALSVTVLRGIGGTQGAAHAATDMVLAAAPPAFQNYDPEGYCNIAPVAPLTGQSVFVPALPLINTRTGSQWLCSTITHTWVPGFANGIQNQPLTVTTAVASATTILPSGPLFHITGTVSMVNVTTPVGCNATAVGGCQFTAICDAACAWTAAGNISAASTTVIAATSVTFTWDATNSKWVPSSAT